MRILLLAPQPLVPLADGLNIRTRYLFRELALRHSVWLFHLQAGADPQGEAVRIPFVATTAVAIKGEHGRAFRHCRDHSAAMEEAIQRCVEKTPVDVVVGS